MYKIQVKRKKVKNITIRVLSETLVTVTAPMYVSDDYLNKVIKERLKWIDEKIEIMKTKNMDKECNLKYLGRVYAIHVIYSEDEKIILEDAKAYIYVKKIDDIKYIKYLIKEWYYKEAKKIFENLIRRYEGITGKVVYAVRIRPMKTRWGSCNTVKSYINLNLNLIEKPMECIEYVVLHEIAHLTYPNHSKEFWNYVGTYMSDFKQRRQKLK
ncbi:MULTISPECIES: M48 family metallopeptidase [Clostridium]|uniref:M48 family peptidase n=1 Tax=Clostridium cadaveris TaxID=1529 RepID=A0A1I2N0V8_9CLOT|nr:SprT family zinc-dependent metalloprotease [Clostridium cadaveris]MDU4953431.1 SprT family zinc-dependent metalloprotease [Clostridium sp.]MDM8311926.1 SprT family zinc-dependent metalloprotease [Clostridium cadaveris]MDY4948690.1 SprT family zinc-dependent metalloprotease [Clostridium cadaveris]NME65363.1 M48 family metallopeptidase [Clostridium cadaveris]NWK11828.1 M48 family metallopeptidase [Clostridium cadaveris]